MVSGGGWSTQTAGCLPQDPCWMAPLSPLTLHALPGAVGGPSLSVTVCFRVCIPGTVCEQQLFSAGSGPGQAWTGFTDYLYP